ncbi:amino acid ABC transporter ATP-binding/permease protein [Maricaulis sp.]|uniref:amino acid ABC transporter ATP-binding/permease protein n=1 Tax=Maricaulis sp. TaxID=1486257 RepID=UPI003A922538
MIRLWTHLGRPQAGRILVAIALSAAGGILAVVLLGVSGWFLTASAIAGSAGAGLLFNHLYPSATVRGTAMGRIVARYGEQLVGHDATLRISSDLRRALFLATARATAGLRRGSSDELSVVLDDVRHVEAGLLRIALPGIAALAGSLAALGFAAFAGILALLTVALGLGAALALGTGPGLRQQRRADAQQAAIADRLRRDATELVENRIELEALGRFTDHAARWGELAVEAETAGLAARRRGHVIAATTSALGGLTALIAVLAGLADGAGIAILAGMALAVLAAHQGLALFLAALANLPATRIALSRVQTRLEASAVIKDVDPAAAQPVTDILPLRLDGLTVGFEPGHPITEPVSLELQSGAVLEVTGPSGTGKTTLLETLARLREPVSGILLFGGIKAQACRAAAIRQSIGIAPQIPDVLPGDLRETLRLAKPDASDAELMSACQIAGFDVRLEADGTGLDQAVEEGGANFSGGELRRLSLARALLRQPRLVLLDEPFAGLDAAMAGGLAGRLAEWAGKAGSALVVVTHSPDRSRWPGLSYQQIELQPLVGRERTGPAGMPETGGRP